MKLHSTFKNTHHPSNPEIYWQHKTKQNEIKKQTKIVINP